MWVALLRHLLVKGFQNWRIASTARKLRLLSWISFLASLFAPVVHFESFLREGTDGFMLGVQLWIWLPFFSAWVLANPRMWNSAFVIAAAILAAIHAIGNFVLLLAPFYGAATLATRILIVVLTSAAFAAVGLAFYTDVAVVFGGFLWLLSHLLLVISIYLPQGGYNEEFLH